MGASAGWVAGLLLIASLLTTEHFLPWVSWHSEVAAFLVVLFLAWTGLARFWRTETTGCIDVPLLVLPFCLIGGVALAQLAGGLMTFLGDAVALWFYLALCIASLLIGFNVEQAAETQSAKERATWPPVALLALTLVVGALGSVVVAFAQVFELWPESAWVARMPGLRRPGGNLGQPNQLATLTLMAMASVVYLYNLRRFNVLVSSMSLIMLCMGLAMSESRAGVLSFGVLLAWWQIKRPVIARNVSPWAGPLVVAVFAVMFISWPPLLSFLQLEATAAVSRLHVADVRLSVWSQLLEAVFQRPWLGWGILEVGKAHNAVAHASVVNNPFTYSHNLLLDWAVWMGIPVALGLAGATAVYIWRRLRMVKELTPWYCLAVAIPLAVHSMLEFPFAYAYFLAPVLFLLGYLERGLRTRALARVGYGPTAIVLVLLSGTMIWSIVEYLSIEEDFRIVRFEALRIGRTPMDHSVPNVVLLTQLGTLLTGSRIELRSGMPAAELEQLRKLALRYPWVATQYRYAVALALNGNQGEAVRQLQVLRWQRDEKTYTAIKGELRSLAQERHPQLRTLDLP